jgi:hypothetical protein
MIKTTKNVTKKKQASPRRKNPPYTRNEYACASQRILRASLGTEDAEEFRRRVLAEIKAIRVGKTYIERETVFSWLQNPVETNPLSVLDEEDL